MNELVVGIRLKSDGSGLVSDTRANQDALKGLTASAGEANRQLVQHVELLDAAADSGRTMAEQARAASGTLSDLREAYARAGASGAQYWEEAKEKSRVGAVAVGAVIATVLAGTLAGVVYTVYKAVSGTLDLIKGLFTGETYKSQYVDSMRQSVKATEDLREQVVNAGRDLRLTTQDAAALALTMDKLGVSQQSYVGTLAGVNQRLREGSEYFNLYGVRVKTVEGEQRSLNEVIIASYATAQQYQEGWARNTVALQLSGVSFKDLEATVKTFTANTSASRDELEAYRLLLGGDAVKAVQEYDKTIAEFNRNASLTSRGFSEVIARAVMPVLTDLADFFKDGWPTAVQVFEYGVALMVTILQGLKNGVYIVTETILAAFESIGTSVMGVVNALGRAVRGDFQGALQELAFGGQAVRQRWSDYMDNIAASSERASNRIKLSLFGGRGAGGIAQANGIIDPRVLPDEEETEEAAKNIARVTSEYDRLLERFREAGAKGQAEIDFFNQFGEEMKGFATVELEASIAAGRLTEATGPQIDELRKLAAAADNNAQAYQRIRKAAEEWEQTQREATELAKRYTQSLLELLKSWDKRTEALRDDVSLIGLEGAAREKRLLTLKYEQDARNVEKDQLQGLKLQYEEQIRLIDERVTRTREIEFWGQVGDAIGRAAAAGRNWRDTLVGGIKDVIRELATLITKKWVISIAASLTGSPALANAASSLGQGGDLVSSIFRFMGFGSEPGAGASAEVMDIVGGGSTAGMGFGGYVGGAFAGAGIGGFAGSLTGRGLPGAGRNGAIGGALGSLIGNFLLPGIGGYIGSALGGLLGGAFTRGGPKDGGSYIGDYNQYGTFTGASSFGGTSRFYTPNGQDSMLAQLSGGAVKSYYDYVRLLGGTAGNLTFGLGFDTDPRGTAPNRVTSGVSFNGRNIYSATNRDIGRDPERIGPELKLEASRAVIAALKESGLPDYLAALFKDVIPEAADQSTIDKLLQTAQAYKVMNDAVRALGGQFETISFDSIKDYVEQLGGLDQAMQKEAFFLERFIPESERAARAQSDFTDELHKLGYESLPKTREEWRRWVEAQDLSTEAGRRARAGLIDLSQAADAFFVRAQTLRDSINGMVAGFNGGSVGGARSTLDRYVQELRRVNPNWANSSLSSEDIGRLFSGGLDPTDLDNYISGGQGPLVESIIRSYIDYANAVKGQNNQLTNSYTNVVDAARSLNDQLNRLADQSLQGFTGGLAQYLSNFSRGQAGIRQYRDSLLVDNTLSPMDERLREAEQQYNATRTLADAGDLNALNRFGTAADTYLRLQTEYSASGGNSIAVRNQILADANRLASRAVDPMAALQAALPQSGRLASSVDMEKLAELVGALIKAIQDGTLASDEQLSALRDALSKLPADTGRELSRQLQQSVRV